MTMEGDLLYCALRFGVNETVGVVRVARPLMEAQRALTALYSVLVVAGLIGLALAVLMGAAISHYFTRALRKLVKYSRGTRAFSQAAMRSQSTDAARWARHCWSSSWVCRP